MLSAAHVYRGDDMMAMKKTQYLMNKLMNFTELDAFTAQKKAGSTSAYFELLDEFSEAAPAILSLLTPPADEEELAAFLRRINVLQKRLLAIGSSPLLWLAEKAAESAKSGSVAKCGDEIFILSGRIKALCVQLDDAKADPAAGGAACAPAAEPAIPEGGNRPYAPVKPELFEKVAILIENFERDDALVMLRSLLSFKYNDEIDSCLATMCSSLVNFDYESAAAQSKKLLKIATELTSGVAAPVKTRVLAIDDVPDVLNTVKAVLKNEYAVYGVTNHMAALKFLTSNTADIILLDIEMPDMNGFALLNIIRKIKAYEITPVLFLTGNVSVENVKKAHSAGARDFIRKPIDAAVLLTKIKKHLL